MEGIVIITVMLECWFETDIIPCCYMLYVFFYKSFISFITLSDCVDEQWREVIKLSAV